MKILISSHAFAPSLGGIETVSGLLAQEFVTQGHEVAVITQTAGDGGGNFPVVRRPALHELFRLIKWCDIFWQNNLSLRTLWPVALRPRPVIVTHQGSYCRRPTGFDVALRLKREVVSRLTGVAISQFVADCLDGHSTVIPNPYDARTFATASTAVERSGELLFVGRLVSEKGLDLLLEALSLLRKRQLRPSLTIVGTGPAFGALQELAGGLGLADHVIFAGPQSGEELARTFHSHRILVVPSRYDEPFGVVALEGVACGCVVVGSQGGGLPEAMGPCGLTFPNGEAGALTDVLEKLLRETGARDRLRAQAPQHLARFHPTTVADQYLDLFRSKLS